jgi:hypothetical protein
MLPAQCDTKHTQVISRKSYGIPISNNHFRPLHGDTVLLVNINDKLHLVVRAKEDSAAVVDALGDDGEHARHVAVDCLAAGY